LDAITEAASVAVTVKLAVPVPVGVPEMVPVAAASDNPAGKEPTVMDQVKGVVPPVAASVVLYAAPFVPAGSGDAVEMAGTALMVKTNACAVVAEAASVRVTVKFAIPAVVGVPEMTPVAAASVSPAGSNPALIDQVYGVVPPVATSVVL